MKITLVALLLCVASLASAQTTYRWVDPATGSTIFSDQPPPPSIKRATKISGDEPGDGRQQSFAVRQAAEKFPVVMYTSADCLDTCQQARNLLNNRGVPFQEKVVQQGTPDMDELKQLAGGEGFVPYLLVGKQGYKGYESGAWSNLLDLAGYPKSAPYGAKPSGAFSK